MAVEMQVTFDSADPATLGAFWAALLGYIEQPPPPGFEDWPTFLRSIGVPEDQMDAAYAIVDPEGRGPRIYIQKVPEAKTAKNRLHLDLNVGGPTGTPPEERRPRVEDAAARAVDLGATRLYEVDRDHEYWVTLADPEGNEFCLQ